MGCCRLTVHAATNAGCSTLETHGRARPSDGAACARRPSVHACEAGAVTADGRCARGFAMTETPTSATASQREPTPREGEVCHSQASPQIPDHCRCSLRRSTGADAHALNSDVPRVGVPGFVYLRLRSMYITALGMIACAQDTASRQVRTVAACD